MTRLLFTYTREYQQRVSRSEYCTIIQKSLMFGKLKCGQKEDQIFETPSRASYVCKPVIFHSRETVVKYYFIPIPQ